MAKLFLSIEVKDFITQKVFISRTGISRQRIFQLINGFLRSDNNRYNPPLWKEFIDYYHDRNGLHINKRKIYEVKKNKPTS